MVKLIPKKKFCDKDNKTKKPGKNTRPRNGFKKKFRKAKNLLTNKPKIKKIKKIKRKKMIKTISPFNINSEINFIYDLENLKDFKIFSSDLNKFKLTSYEITQMKKIIDDINALKVNKSYSKSLKVSNEIYDNFKKLIPAPKNLSAKELLISDIFYNNSFHGNISLRKIKNIYENQTNDRISISTLSNILKFSLGLRFLKTTVKPKILSDIIFKRKSYLLIRLIYEVLTKGMNLVFIDESKIQIKNSNFKMWNRKDSFNYNSIKNEKINLILGVSKEKVIYYEFHQQNINTTIFKNYLIRLLEKLGSEEKKSAVLFMDNARPHKSKKIKKFYEENNLKIITNVPYESSFNRVELSFRFIKNILYKKIFTNINDIVSEVISILESEKFCNSLPLQYKETLEKYIYYHNKYMNENLNLESLRN